MFPVTQRLLEDLAEKLSRDLPDLEEILLFGSRARGDHEHQSDVDLLLIVDRDFDRGGDRWEYVKKVREAKSPFPIPLDFRVFTAREVEHLRHLPNHIVAVALGEGRPLFRRARVAAVA